MSFIIFYLQISSQILLYVLNINLRIFTLLCFSFFFNSSDTFGKRLKTCFNLYSFLAKAHNIHLRLFFNIKCTWKQQQKKEKSWKTKYAFEVIAKLRDKKDINCKFSSSYPVASCFPLTQQLFLFHSILPYLQRLNLYFLDYFSYSKAFPSQSFSFFFGFFQAAEKLSTRKFKKFFALSFGCHAGKKKSVPNTNMSLTLFAFCNIQQSENAFLVMEKSIKKLLFLPPLFNFQFFLRFQVCQMWWMFPSHPFSPHSFWLQQFYLQLFALFLRQFIESIHISRLIIFFSNYANDFTWIEQLEEFSFQQQQQKL